jgi:hypothetical protein
VEFKEAFGNFKEPGYLSGIALGYGLDDQGFESRQRPGIFLFTTASRPALVSTQSPIQWVPEGSFSGVKRPGCEAEHSPPSRADVKNAWSCTSIPNTPPWCGAQLKESIGTKIVIGVKVCYGLQGRQEMSITLHHKSWKMSSVSDSSASRSCPSRSSYDTWAMRRASHQHLKPGALWLREGTLTENAEETRLLSHSKRNLSWE